MFMVWWRAALFAACIGFIVVPAVYLVEPAWIWPTVGTALAWYLLGHLLGLARLVAWLRGPLDAPVPEAGGIWNEVFALLHRRVKARQAEQSALSRSLDRFQRAAEALPDGIILCDRDGRIDWMNPTACRHFQLNAERDAGQLLTNLVRQPAFARYLAERRYAEPFVYRSERVHALTLMIQVVPYGEEQVLLMSRDVSHVERLETMRRDFVANVSHELKTPLTVVAGFAETLLDHHAVCSPEELREYVGHIHEQAARMRRLIEDLLTLSALETGSAAGDEAVAVDTLLRALVAEAELLSDGRHRITLSVEGPTQLRGSGRELESAFGNLLTNAVRYTPAGGEIRVSWQADASGAELAVADNGIGIAPEHLPRLTERFYRVDRGRSRDTGGTGLGLAIVKHVAARHEATLDIQSQPGAGSRFSLRFSPSRLILSYDQSL